MPEEPEFDYTSDDAPVRLTGMLDEGRVDEIIDLCTRALRADAVQGDETWRGYYLIRRGHARMWAGRYPRAIADLEQGLELLPTATFRGWLGQAYSRDGRYDAAIETFRALLDAGVSEGLACWLSLELATAQRASGRIGEALATVERYRGRGEAYREHRLLRYEILLELNPGLWAKEAARRSGDAAGGLGLIVGAKAAAAQGDPAEAQRLWKAYLAWHEVTPMAHPFWKRLAEAKVK
jgi:tetratricopeptide (TPR) repeat protein